MKHLPHAFLSPDPVAEGEGVEPPCRDSSTTRFRDERTCQCTNPSITYFLSRRLASSSRGVRRSTCRASTLPETLTLQSPVALGPDRSSPSTIWSSSNVFTFMIVPFLRSEQGSNLPSPFRLTPFPPVRTCHVYQPLHELPRRPPRLGVAEVEGFEPPAPRRALRFSRPTP